MLVTGNTYYMVDINYASKSLLFAIVELTDEWSSTSALVKIKNIIFQNGMSKKIYSGDEYKTIDSSLMSLKAALERIRLDLDVNRDEITRFVIEKIFE